MWIRSLFVLSLLSGSPAIYAAVLTFDRALSIAEQSSPDIEAQTASVDAARAASHAAGALPDPKLVFGIDNLPADGPDQWRVDRDFMTMRKVGVMQEFPNSARRHAAAAAASATIDEADAQRRVHVVAVRTNAALAWLDRYFIEKRIALFAALTHENQMFTKTVEAALAGGRGTPADVIAPQEEAADLGDRLDALRADDLKARAALRRLLGTDGDETLTGEPPPFAIDADQLRSHVHTHPELAVFGPMIALAQAQVSEAAAAKRPDWGVELSYAKRAVPFSDMVSLQFTVSLPFFSSTRQDPLISAKHQELRRLEAERVDMVRDHTQALEAELADLAMLDSQLARLTGTRLLLAHQKANFQLASYQGGKGDLAAVLGARRELIDLQLMQLDLQGRRDAAAAKIHFSYAEFAP